MYTLPKFKGWTVDAGLKEFRRMTDHSKWDMIIPFDSIKGEELLSEYIKTLKVGSEEFRRIAEAVIEKGA